MEVTEIHSLCKKHLHRYVLITMRDGMTYDGIIESVESEHVVLAVPATEQMHAAPCGCGGTHHHHHGHYGQQGQQAQPSYQGQHGAYRPAQPFFGPGFYGPGFFGPGFYGPGFFGPRRRFNRVVLPLAALTAISLLPYF